MEKTITPSVGLGVTVHGWTDSKAYTIKSVSKSGRQFIMTEDEATLDPNFKPQWVPGGFAGHCTNQEEQSYTYETRPNGYEVKVSLRKDGKWRVSGEKNIAYLGVRRKFHDYNF